ncbi:MAG: ATP-binding protein [archaeon]
MDAEQVKILLKERENLTLEFKERYTAKMDEDIVAFSNTKGGVIILGVKDNGTVVGEQLTNDMKAKINSLAKNCEPSISVQLSQAANVVIIEVNEGMQRPYRCGTGYFRRLDGSTQKMTNEELRIMFGENEPLSFEERTSNCTIDDISDDKVKKFLQEAKVSITDQSTADILTSTNVLKSSKINNAGILLFSKNVKKFLPQAKMTLLWFKGTTKSIILDRQDVEDDLLTQFEQAIFFIKKHLNVKSVIEGTDRTEIYDIPQAVWREATANAIIHRDYARTGTNISVEVYDDRLLISSPGGLPKGLSKKEFGKISIRRNELIADFFYRMGKVERAGTGIQRMKDKMKEAGLPEPSFEVENFFIVTMQRTQEGIKPKSETLTPKQEQILALLKENPSLTQAKLAEKLGDTQRHIQRIIVELKKRDFIEHTGSKKAGQWVVKKS